jgi:hypothetical protein
MFASKLKNGIAVELTLKLKRVNSLTGNFRVWDEGHAVGSFYPRNPHHVFEVHPAWASLEMA